jgi:uncharacterized coiled-coil DUF342 family protein
MSDDPMSSVLLRIEELESECKQLREELNKRINMCDMRSETIIELIAERDEARREICIMLEDATNNHRKNHAKRWGWDCFRENSK